VRRARDLLASLLICACLPASAHAAQSARLHVSFTPERLGHGTTVNISVEIAAPANRAPPPLTAFDVTYPRDLGFDVSGLGLATCSQTSLESFGPSACPPNSYIGRGSALAEIPVGPEIIRETAEVTIVRAPKEGQIALLFYANGESPVSAPIVFPGLLVPGPGDNESIDIDVPLVPSLPEAPDVALVRLHATLGPQGLTYYEHIRHHLVPYRPQGILLPNKCPRGGFPFGATLSFLDGSHTHTDSTVPCPVHDNGKKVVES
jgi:hypothetical protein